MAQQGQGPFKAASGAFVQPLTGAAGLLSGGLLSGPLNLGSGYAAALNGADAEDISTAFDRFTPSLGADPALFMSFTVSLKLLLTDYQVPILVFYPEQETTIRWID
ncbi:MAG: hypothetical protein AAF572_07305 [Cyanobacteria bacterium P01_B01_bin.77]